MSELEQGDPTHGLARDLVVADSLEELRENTPDAERGEGECR